MYGGQGEKAGSSLSGRRRWRGGAVPEAPCDGDCTSCSQHRGCGEDHELSPRALLTHSFYRQPPRGGAPCQEIS